MGMPEEDPPAGVPEWVLTYGDMMSLLLCFFILLAAMSRITKDEPKDFIMISLIEQFGDETTLSKYRESLRASASSNPEGNSADTIEQIDPKDRAAVVGKKSITGKDQKVTAIESGRKQMIGDPIEFPPNQAELVGESLRMLDRSIQEISGKNHIVDVRAVVNAEDLPVDSTYPNQIELAYQRANLVADRLRDTQGIDEKDIRITLVPIELFSDSSIAQREKDRVRIFVYETSEIDFDR